MRKFLFVVILLVIFKTEAQTSVLNFADSLYVNGNFSKAIEHYKTYDNQSEVYDKIAKAYVAIGNYDLALQNYEAAINANADDMLVKYEYAKLLSKTKKFKAASKTFKTLIKTDSLNPNYHYELGLVLEKQKDSTALSYYKTAFNLDQEHQKAIYKVAKHHVKKRHHEIAENYINKGLESYENNAELINLKALNYYWQEKYLIASKWFEKLLELGQSTEFIHEKLSLCYAQEYEFKKAIKHRKIALKFNPYDASAMFVIGTYYQKIEDFINAEKFMEKALKLLNTPLDHEYQRLGVVYNHQKRHKDAIEAFNIALKENPNNISTPFFLARTKEEYYKDYDAKIKVYEDFKKKYPNNLFIKYAEHRISELKQQQFLDQD
ncbi:tetratricopeptide repeat protein [Ichthyenterobacterium magnum]|uniref:Tetratricopeptide repeat protein n=1 Tax=Ichthyenterobacterium magnum TaxID=1230530 RepID=A0A420DW58_9FLAO|nr:tetratricopeptide repeat protein [Ichthyenterobacterium magnum]RKE98468.1 tetratricopeptide repeat protein [Ichthyenterobacterium magnum]